MGEHISGLLEINVLTPNVRKLHRYLFFCELVHSEVTLKKDHQYYYRVQVQLYVAADMYEWCDFCA